jgi:hypothetical protein
MKQPLRKREREFPPPTSFLHFTELRPELLPLLSLVRPIFKFSQHVVTYLRCDSLHRKDDMFSSVLANKCLLCGTPSSFVLPKVEIQGALNPGTLQVMYRAHLFQSILQETSCPEIAKRVDPGVEVLHLVGRSKCHEMEKGGG